MATYIKKISRSIEYFRLRLSRKWIKYWPWYRKDDGSDRKHARTLIDLFVTILMHKGRLSARDADAALDILRYTFPELEHRWLANQFDNSRKSAESLETVLKEASFHADEAERMAIAIEVLSLLKNRGDHTLIDELFEKITYGLELPGIAPHLKRLLLEPGTEAQEPAFSVSFGCLKTEVVLPYAEDGLRFRLIRCARLVMVINDGEVPIIVRGRKLAPGNMTPLTAGQLVSFGNFSISYEEFSFFLETKRTGKGQILYSYLQDGTLQLTANRNRLSQIKLNLGLSCKIEVIRPNIELKLKDNILQQGDIGGITYYEPFYVNGFGPFSVGEIKDASDVAGGYFRIDPATRKVRVTNLPEKARKGDMLLTPGLAPGIVLEVTFSSGESKAWLQIIENSTPIQLNQKNIRRKEIELHDGDVIRLNAYQSIRCQIEAGVLDEEYNAIRSLSVESMIKEYPRAGRVLDNIDFQARRGEMVCVLGPSGCGKSTLLSILAGHLNPTKGKVRYNNQSLYNNSENLLPYIAYIPREDILDSAMSVAEHLQQAATIRRSRLSHYERVKRSNAILKYLGLTHIASRRVGRTHERRISDGERTRLNLGLDLAGVADVFLIDEPISGLSSSDAEMVIDTLESLKRNKLVIATVHRPSTSLLHRFDKVLVLDHGGQMAYWGETSGLIKYFRKAAKDLGIQVSAENQNSESADFVFEVLDAPLKWHDRRRRQHPRLWQEIYEGFRFRQEMGKASEFESPLTLFEPSKNTIPIRPKRKSIQLWRLFWVWVTRTFLGRVRSRMGLYTMLLEGPVLALLIAITLRASSGKEYIFKDALHIPSYLFMSSVAAMFFGLTGAASEVLKDAPLIKRERNYRMFTTGYISAKALVLTMLTAVQSALYLVVGNLILESHDMFLQYWIVMILTSFIGISLSILVSNYARTERAALNMVPLLLIPQVLLAGAMIPFDEMNQFVPWKTNRTYESDQLKPGRVPLIAETCPLRYSYEMLIVRQATHNIWELERKKIQTELDKLKNKPGVLSDEEHQRIKLILRGLTAISSVGASSHKEAKQNIRAIRRLVLSSNSLEEFDQYLATKDEILEKRQHPLPDYFVNSRVSGLYEFAEAQRQSRETTDHPNIFLAHLQPLPFIDDGKNPDDPGYSADNNTMSTLIRDTGILMIMGLVPLIITGLSIKKRLEIKNKR